MRIATAMCALAAALVACSERPASGWAGYVEGEYVHVAAPVAGTLQALDVQAGQNVAAGAPLFRLDAQPAADAAAEAEARRRAAQAQAANTTSGRRADEIAVTQAQLAQARSAAERAAAEWQRQQALQREGFVSPQRVDDARAAERQARDRVAELEAALRVARLPARGEEQAAARASADAASAALAQVRWREGQAAQRAPVAGLVAETYYRAGEYVAAGQPVLSLLAPSARVARFWVAETERGALAPGQAVQLRCDGCGAAIAASISRIATAPEYTPPVIYSNGQRQRLVFMVEARATSASDAARLPPGQPIEVTR
ncbi:HlyD family secretion protein [Ideonella alba]|uniref:HlyD family efflux transporter periplasmic adaptor subunit n=1 Tax=Ideonella alba TaxID=2824118 RepID=A0A940YCF7_9BURK|nr:HlyD family efflux transporter periplasmic adaptor subunit [Ideonella alba]MBQ0930102.1 HlyD family efflux transporter periplasmic adaptor subunit [Ideonella alba]